MQAKFEKYQKNAYVFDDFTYLIIIMILFVVKKVNLIKIKHPHYLKNAILILVVVEVELINDLRVAT